MPDNDAASPDSNSLDRLDVRRMRWILSFATGLFMMVSYANWATDEADDLFSKLCPWLSITCATTRLLYTYTAPNTCALSNTDMMAMTSGTLLPLLPSLPSIWQQKPFPILSDSDQDSLPIPPDSHPLNLHP